MTTIAGRIVAAATAFAALAPAAPAGAAARNLLPNPSFEQSAFEPSPVPQGTQPQPLLPSGWIFEGASVLFDHTPNAYRTGKRGVAISGALGGGRRICDPTLEQPPSPLGYDCIANPADGPWKTATAPLNGHYSVRPAWRTLDPVAVRAGTSYDLAFWGAMPTLNPAALPQGEGAVSFVRWLNADGETIKTSAGPTVLANGSVLVWRRAQKSLRAPAGAVEAHILLGQSNAIAFTQVAFDDVFFGLTPTRR